MKHNYAESELTMRHPRIIIASVLLALTASLGLGSTEAKAGAEEQRTQVTLDTKFESMTPTEIYAAKTAVSHEDLLKQLGLTEDDVATPSAVAAASGCFFASDGDHVHRSTYSGINYASGHGWWLNINCPSGTRANVTIWLQENLNGTWYLQGNKVTGTNRLPGSSSTQRVNAKLKCVNSTTHEWRSLILADLVGRTDAAPLAYTTAQSLACY